jgi:hypothetical protein
LAGSASMQTLPRVYAQPGNEIAFYSGHESL